MYTATVVQQFSCDRSTDNTLLISLKAQLQKKDGIAVTASENFVYA